MIGSLARFIDADPGDRWSRLALAENYRRMGRSEDAEKTLGGLPRGEPDVIDLLARIALDRQARKKPSGCLRPDRVMIRFWRGCGADSLRGDAKSAIDDFRIAFAADPLNRETLFGLSAALELSGDPKAAEPYRQAAANLDRLNSFVQRAAVPKHE